MPKKIVVFSDGTGNSAAKARKTNVWRLYEALDQTTSDQIALYDDGVGTSSNRYLAIFGGAFGWGLKRNVLDLYKFVCRNYQPGDEIYGFGFSRGAFTIRTLVGLIASEGLVVSRSEEELQRNAAAAYRHFRSECFPSWSPIVYGFRWLRDRIFWTKDWLKGYRTYEKITEETEKAGRQGIHIRFLGLWDTVEAYGVPIKELKQGIDWVLWPLMFGDLKLSPLVDRACHALSLDDERATFHPLVWDEKAEAENVDAKTTPPGRITQVWFAGVHSNVGGGYPDDRLAWVSLEWMMAEAMANGLVLDPVAVNQISKAKSPFGKLYNSRGGLAAYYRYSPRRVPFPQYKGKEIRPIVHGSVVMRMAQGTDNYAPISLPRKFWVLGFDGNLFPMEGPSDRLEMDVTKRHTASAAVPCDDLGASRRTNADLRAAIETLKSPAQDAVSLVWDTVWWRRVLYTITVLLTATLVLYPWLHEFLASLVGALPFVDVLESSSRGIVGDLVEAVSGFLPSFAQPWTEALQQHPIMFAILAAATFLSFYTGHWLQTRIHDRACLAWHDARRANYLSWLSGNQAGWRKALLIGALLSLFLFGLARWLGSAQSTQIIYILVGALLFLLLFYRLAEKAKFGETGSKGEITAIPPTFALSAARRLRRNRVLASVNQSIFEKLVPILFGVLLLVAIVFLTNRFLFDAASAAGYYCKGSKNPVDLEESDLDLVESTRHFKTDDICWNTGIVLQRGQHYRVSLQVNDDWFDETKHTDVEGFRSYSLVRYLKVPLRRWWTQKWFQPIARIGRLGNDEYVLTPAVPLLSSSDMQRTLSANIEAKTSGELYIFVNDAVLVGPRSIQIFYHDNRGTAELRVERINR